MSIVLCPSCKEETLDIKTGTCGNCRKDFSTYPIHQDVSGAPFRIGNAVKVIGAADETFNMQYMGQIGVVVHFEYSCGCGQSYPWDPMIGVRFSDSHIEEFWKEELAKCQGVKPSCKTSAARTSQQRAYTFDEPRGREGTEGRGDTTL